MTLLPSPICEKRKHMEELLCLKNPWTGASMCSKARRVAVTSYGFDFVLWNVLWMFNKDSLCS